MLSIRRALIVSALATLTVAVVSQEPVQQAQPPAASQSAVPLPSSDAMPKSFSSSLGVYVFATNGQAPDLQSKDEGSCSWAKGQTGIDPTAPPPPTQAATATQQTAPDPSKGSGAKGAAGGAAAGAAIGATAGRKAKKQEQAQQQQAQAGAQADDRKTTYNKAFSACMEGKG
jgi:hypothetical protein